MDHLETLLIPEAFVDGSMARRQALPHRMFPNLSSEDQMQQKDDSRNASGSGYPQKPGETPQKPGPYKPVAPFHRPPPAKPEPDITMPPGHKPLPPTPRPGEQWVPKKKP